MTDCVSILGHTSDLSIRNWVGLVCGQVIVDFLKQNTHIQGKEPTGLAGHPANALIAALHLPTSLALSGIDVNHSIN